MEERESYLKLRAVTVPGRLAELAGPITVKSSCRCPRPGRAAASTTWTPRPIWESSEVDQGLWLGVALTGNVDVQALGHAPVAGQFHRAPRTIVTRMSLIRREKQTPGRTPPALSQPLPRGLYLFANRLLMIGTSPATAGPGMFPRYAYRESPEEPADSGWRVFTGLETQAGADDATNFQINTVETLTTYHPALSQILVEGVHGAWEWDDSHGIYRQVDIPSDVAEL